MDPSFVPVHHDLGFYYAHMGMSDQWLHEALAVSDPEHAQILRNLYAQGGYRKVISESALSGGTFHIPKTRESAFVSAMAYSALGDHRQALAALEKSYQAREPGLIYLKVDPIWDSLRGQAAFQTIEHRMGLQ